MGIGYWIRRGEVGWWKGRLGGGRGGWRGKKAKLESLE